jgi:hypothetical protein
MFESLWAKFGEKLVPKGLRFSDLDDFQVKADEYMDFDQIPIAFLNA